MKSKLSAALAAAMTSICSWRPSTRIGYLLRDPIVGATAGEETRLRHARARLNAPR